MLLNLSEEFFEDAGKVEFARSMMLQNPHPQDPEAFVRQLAARRHDARDRLGSLSMPVLVIGGERRHPRARVEIERAGRLIPAKLVVMDRRRTG